MEEKSLLRHEEKNGMMCLYEWENIKELIDTNYGVITVEKWMELEKKRLIKDKTRTAHVVYNTNKTKCSLLVNRVDG